MDLATLTLVLLSASVPPERMESPAPAAEQVSGKAGSVAKPLHVDFGEAVPGAAASSVLPDRRVFDVSNADLSALLPQRTLTEWEREYEAAKRRRSGGLRKVAIGLISNGAGAGLMLAGVARCGDVYAECDGGSTALVLSGVGAAGVGTVYFWWGIIQWVGANGDVRSLEATRPAPSSVPLGDRQAVSFTLGERSVVAYHVSW